MNDPRLLEHSVKLLLSILRHAPKSFYEKLCSDLLPFCLEIFYQKWIEASNLDPYLSEKDEIKRQEIFTTFTRNLITLLYSLHLKPIEENDFLQTLYSVSPKSAVLISRIASAALKVRGEFNIENHTEKICFYTISVLQNANTQRKFHTTTSNFITYYFYFYSIFLFSFNIFVFTQYFCFYSIFLFLLNIFVSIVETSWPIESITEILVNTMDALGCLDERHTQLIRLIKECVFILSKSNPDIPKTIFLSHPSLTEFSFNELVQRIGSSPPEQHSHHFEQFLEPLISVLLYFSLFWYFTKTNYSLQSQEPKRRNQVF